jgi:hypothetical protein
MGNTDVTHVLARRRDRKRTKGSQCGAGHTCSPAWTARTSVASRVPQTGTHELVILRDKQRNGHRTFPARVTRSPVRTIMLLRQRPQRNRALRHGSMVDSTMLGGRRCRVWGSRALG